MMALAADRHFLTATRALLRQDRPDRPLDLFRQNGIPKSQGYRILRFYEYHGAVRTSRSIETDPRRILTLQGGLRAERAIPDRNHSRGPPLELARELLEENAIPYAIGLQTAANLHAYFEPAGAHTIYVGRPKTTTATTFLSQVEQVLATDGPSSSAQPYELYLDDLDRLDVQDGPRGSMTSPLQTLLDLCLHGRTAAHRGFLFDQLQKQGIIDG